MADRNFYLDAQRAQQITETIGREKRIQRGFFEREAAAGRLRPWHPPAPPTRLSLLESVGLPPFASAYQDPELALATSLSKHMTQVANPGYVLRDGAHLRSSTHADHAWDEQAVAFMRAGGVDKHFFKRRDDFVSYVEAAARAHHQLGNRPSAAATAAKK